MIRQICKTLILLYGLLRSKQNKHLDLGMKTSIRTNCHFKYRSFEQSQRCCICGSTNCEQSVDHNKVNLKDLNSILKNHMYNQQQLQQIKGLISGLYSQIKINLIKQVQLDEYQLQTYINNFYFSKEYFQLNKIDLNIFTDMLQKNNQRFPSKSLIRIVKKLKSKPKHGQSPQVSQIKQSTYRILNDFNLQAIISDLKTNLPLKFFKQVQIVPQLKPKRSVSDVINPEQADSLDQNKVYEWRNIRVTKNSRIVALSNKNISDRQVVEQIPVIANYKNIKQFQIRNNEISSLTCNLIANNMPFLLSVDIRGNKIDDKGIIKLVRGIPNMKTFYISQTLATDESGKEIVQNLPQLQMLWAQHTHFTNQISLRIAMKSKLKVLSLMGNPINDDYKQKMKKIFISKGYIVI